MKRADQRITSLCLFMLCIGWAGMAMEGCPTALLVIDVQTVFLDGHPWLTAGEEDIVRALEVLIDLARHAGVPVVYIQDITQDPDFVASETMEFAPAIAPQEGDPIFTKLSGDAFTNPDLGLYLETRGIQQLLISGIASDGCVHATLVSAYRAGYDVFVATDAHAHRDGTPASAEQRNAYWLGLGLKGRAMTEIDWEAFGCSPEEDEPDI